MKQPILGIVGLIIVMAIAFGIISLFSADTFAGWVTYFVAVCVPVEVVIGMVWQLGYPPFIRGLAQPVRGIALVLLTFAMAAVITAILFYTQAAAISPPTPFALIYVIFAVLVTFWFVVVWGMWPVSAVNKSPLVLGLSTLVITYVVGWLLFELLFDFSFMAGAPFYSTDLDPQGLFNGFEILSYSVTTVAVVFMFIVMDFWPITAVPAFRKQPVMGIVTSIAVLAIAGVAYWLGVIVMGQEPIKFMVFCSIGFLFGSLLPIIMFEGTLFSNMKQPVKGLLGLVVAIISGAILPKIYWALAPALSGELVAGAPNYQYELWLASALLAMTFPLMVAYAQFFNFWPIRGKAAAPVPEEVPAAE